MEIIQEVRKTQVQAIRIRQTTYTIWHGNVWEWTMEAYNGQAVDTNKGHIYRGGAFRNNGYSYPVSHRGIFVNVNSKDSNLGGRVQLYIK